MESYAATGLPLMRLIVGKIRAKANIENRIKENIHKKLNNSQKLAYI